MRTLRIYLPSIVLLLWAGAVYLFGRTDALIIGGLIITAVAVGISVRELAKHYREKQNGHGRHRHA